MRKNQIGRMIHMLLFVAGEHDEGSIKAFALSDAR
jgi:hypothetical protein